MEIRSIAVLTDTNADKGVEQASVVFYASHLMIEFDQACLGMLQFSVKIMNHNQTYSLTNLSLCPVDF